MLPTKFPVNWPFSSGEEAKNNFQDCRTSHPNASCQVSSQLAFWFRRNKKIDFQDGCHSGHLGFPIETILAISDLQVTPMLPISFKSIGLSVQEKKWKIVFKMVAILDFGWKDISYFWSVAHSDTSYQVSSQLAFCSGEEDWKRFSRWWPSWISDWNYFSYFWSTSHPNAPNQVSNQSVQWFSRSCWKCEKLTDGQTEGWTDDGQQAIA